MKKLVLIILVFTMFTGCSKTTSYEYIEGESQNADWSVESGKIWIRDGEDSLKFKVKYIGDYLIEEGETWSCEVLVCKKDEESSIQDAEVIFTRLDISSKEMSSGYTKIVDTTRDMFDIENDYDFSSVYLRINYAKNNEANDVVMKLLVKS